MKWYKYSLEQLEKHFSSNLKNGLTQDEAAKRLERIGFNELRQEEKASSLLLFLSQFKDFMVVVLLAATLISGLLGEYLDAVAIILIVVLNGILGFVQERRAEKSLNALKELSSPKMTVLRDRHWISIDAREVVPGDIIKVEAGDRVGADIRLMEASNLYVEESALTGESLPVHKITNVLTEDELSLADQENLCFTGTMVTKGKGIGIAVATGMDTEMGKIAHLLSEEDSKLTPLQMRLEQLGRILIFIALLLTALVVIAGVYQGRDMYAMFLSGVSLAVAAIPEGLPAIVTIALALGVQKMIKRRAIVRKLPSVETLGCATVICSDKTGTLTQNRMTVTELWVGGKQIRITGNGTELNGNFLANGQELNVSNNEALLQLLLFGALCNNAEINRKEDSELNLSGDPTEIAMLVAASKAGIHKNSLTSKYKVIKEFSFDSARKMMSVIVEAANKERYVITKGAPDIVLSKSEEILWRNSCKSFNENDRQQVNQVVERMGGNALRTIAVAYRKLLPNEVVETESQAESNLVFVGLEGMIDPPRPEVKDSILQCQRAGIKTIMITGDHLVTAKAIAKQLGILPDNGKVMDGSTLSGISSHVLEKQVNDIYVYARVSPEHKLKIVKALRSKGHIVAMTGDGVNDAPAIKAADIGVAMGITGTDVAKEASSLVLSDDNFATIRAAIEEGRNIYENIRKFIRYLLASNVGEILVMLFAVLLGLPLPLVPIQILWVNLVTDGLPAMALGIDSAEEDVMNRSPRKPSEGVFARRLGWKIVSRGFMIGIVSILAFVMVYYRDPNQLIKAQTTAFATLVMAQLIHVFDCRSEKSVFHRNPFSNMYLVLAVLSSVLLLLVVMYYPPLQTIFHTTTLSIRDWLLILGLSAVPTFALAGMHLFRKR